MRRNFNSALPASWECFRETEYAPLQTLGGIAGAWRPSHLPHMTVLQTPAWHRSSCRAWQVHKGFTAIRRADLGTSWMVATSAKEVIDVG